MIPASIKSVPATVTSAHGNGNGPGRASQKLPSSKTAPAIKAAWGSAPEVMTPRRVPMAWNSMAPAASSQKRPGNR